MSVISTNRLNRFWKKGVKPIKEQFDIMAREQKAPYGFFGIEQNLDQLMEWVRAGQWDKFAIGDYFIDQWKIGKKVQWEIADKNPYLHCGNQGKGLESNHIYCIPRDCFEEKVQFAYTGSGDNIFDNGYPGTLVPDRLETYVNNHFSEKIKSYMKTVGRRETYSGTNSSYNQRRIWLPSIVELTGNLGSRKDTTLGPICHSLALYTGGNAHLTKGRGFGNSANERMLYWTSDPANLNRYFCCIDAAGGSSSASMTIAAGIAPGIILG